MRFLIRLLGALWLATLIVSAGFAWYEVHAERRRLIDDLQRRAALAADAVREASERQVARGSRTGYASWPASAVRTVRSRSTTPSAR
jgi:hypothetical protein